MTNISDVYICPTCTEMTDQRTVSEYARSPLLSDRHVVSQTEMSCNFPISPFHYIASTSALVLSVLCLCFSTWTSCIHIRRHPLHAVAAPLSIMHESSPLFEPCTAAVLSTVVVVVQVLMPKHMSMYCSPGEREKAKALHSVHTSIPSLFCAIMRMIPAY